MTLILSGAWFYATPSYEPEITLLGSLIAFIGSRSIATQKESEPSSVTSTDEKNIETTCEAGTLIAAMGTLRIYRIGPVY